MPNKRSKSGRPGKNTGTSGALGNRAREGKPGKNAGAAGVAALLGALAGQPGGAKALKAFLGTYTNPGKGQYGPITHGEHKRRKAHHKKAASEAAAKAREQIKLISGNYKGPLKGTLTSIEQHLRTVIADRSDAFSKHKVVKGEDKRAALIARSQACKLSLEQANRHKRMITTIINEVNPEIDRVYTNAKRGVDAYRLHMPKALHEPAEGSVDARSLISWYAKAARRVLFMEANVLRHKEGRTPTEDAYLGMIKEYTKLHKKVTRHLKKIHHHKNKHAKHAKKHEPKAHQPEPPEYKMPPNPDVGAKATGLDRLLSAAYPQPYSR